MRVAVFSTKPYDRTFLSRAAAGYGHDLTFFEPKLDRTTARLAEGFPAVCAFVNDTLDAEVIDALAAGGTRIVALRAAGFNNVALDAAEEKGVTVLRVPAYSPHAVAEFSVGLLLALDRRIHRAWARVRENNFALEGLLGHDLHGRTVGIVGTGRIGALVARAYRLGFGCEVVAHDRLRERTMELASELAGGPRRAMALAKAAINDGGQGSLDAGLDVEEQAFVDVFETDDAAVGVGSFRRHGPGKAAFSGR